MDEKRKHMGPPGLSRIEDDGRRTAQTIVDATEYERLVAVEKAARDLVAQVDVRSVGGLAWVPVNHVEYAALAVALGMPFSGVVDNNEGVTP